MLQFKPTSITLPLLNFGPIADLEVGTEAFFPNDEMGIVTAVGSKTTVHTTAVTIATKLPRAPVIRMMYHCSPMTSRHSRRASVVVAKSIGMAASAGNIQLWTWL